MNKNEDEHHDKRIKDLEERVQYLESVIKNFIKNDLNSLNSLNSINEINNENDFDEVRKNIIINKDHLSQVLESSMEEQIILIMIQENRKNRFMKMTKDLQMYKNGWVYMEDSDLKLFIETIEHKILLLHSKSSYNEEKCFENNKIIYGLNLSVRFKKIKNKLIDAM